jgi:hypothetical protein
MLTLGALNPLNFEFSNDEPTLSLKNSFFSTKCATYGSTFCAVSK